MGASGHLVCQNCTDTCVDMATWVTFIWVQSSSLGDFTYWNDYANTICWDNWAPWWDNQTYYYTSNGNTNQRFIYFKWIIWKCPYHCVSHDCTHRHLCMIKHDIQICASLWLQGAGMDVLFTHRVVLHIGTSICTHMYSNTYTCVSALHLEQGSMHV